MSRGRDEEETESPSILESELYETVRIFFEEKKNCENTGTDAKPISLRVFGGTIHPDVFGISNPTSKNFKAYMAEGKLTFMGRNFDECKGQAITLQRFADYVYIFFPKSSWNKLNKEEQSDVISECKNLKLGLLLIDKGRCEEMVAPYPNMDLLEEENRTLVKDEMVHYFPDFAGPEENTVFFERYRELADNVVSESCELLEEYLVNSFTKFTLVKKQSVKNWYLDDSFEFYLFSKLKNSEVFLIMKPFGSDVFETSTPTLLIQERFKSSLIGKKNLRQKMAKHMEFCLRRKCHVDAHDLIFYEPDTAEEVISHIENSKPKDFSIFEKIDILGIEKEKIKETVEESLQRIFDSNSLT